MQFLLNWLNLFSCKLIRKHAFGLTKLSSFHQFFNITVTAHQHALDKHHGKCGPTRPHFEGVALAPFTEVTAVFQIVVLDVGG